MRITDEAVLECVKEACGETRFDIEAAFSQGLPNTPMQHSRIRVVSGNFVTARPMGIIDGVDFRHTGLVRKVDAQSIEDVLNRGFVVLVSPFGFSPRAKALTSRPKTSPRPSLLPSRPTNSFFRSGLQAFVLTGSWPRNSRPHRPKN